MYQTLPDNNIRLLILASGTGTDPVYGTLEVVDLDSHPRYEAISYLWGPPQPGQSIQVGEEGQLDITENAAGALRRLRLPDGPRIVWMDQICINQADLSERSRQVSIMHRIFGMAEKVLMYLGPDPNDLAQDAGEILADLQSRWEKPVVFRYTYEQTFQDENLPPPESRKWKAFRSIMGLQYFKRVWMLQEVMLATEAVAFWGDHVQIPWLSIARAASWGEASPDLAGFEEHSFISEEDCAMVKQMLATEDDEDRRLKWRIGLLSYRQATDPRDKIFAVMNLVGEEERMGLTADYSMKTVDVYKATAEHIIFTLDQSLDVLQNATLASNHPALQGDRWPSWVPRWGDIDYSFICGVQSGVFLPCDRLELDASVDDDKLCVRGVEVGKIKHQARRDWHTASERNEVHTFDEVWRLTKQYGDPNIDTEPLALQVIWTLLCCEADFPDSELDGWPGEEWQDRAEQLRQEYSWSFIEYYLFAMLYYNVRPEHFDLLEAIVLARLGLLAEPFDRSYPTHAQKAKAWKEDIRHQGFDFNVYEMCRDDQKRFDPTREVSENEFDLYMLFMHAVFRYNQPVTYDVTGAKYWQSAFHECGEFHRFFVTDSGRIGMASNEAQPGDIVAILFGTSVPFLLRPVADAYLVVSSCYCYTIMRGQYVKALKASGTLEAETRTFILN